MTNQNVSTKKVPVPSKLIFKTFSDYLKHVEKTMGEIHVGVSTSSKGKK
jgi:hypothetical protein